jgi:hypothetical protein
MNEEQRLSAIQELAKQLEQRRFATPARMFLDVVVPLGFMASQVALLVQPFFPHGRWRLYVTALTDEQGWEALQRILNSEEC